MLSTLRNSKSEIGGGGSGSRGGVYRQGAANSAGSHAGNTSVPKWRGNEIKTQEALNNEQSSQPAKGVKTSQGLRIYDATTAFVGRANKVITYYVEVKTGYTSLTSRISGQVAKDAEVMYSCSNTNVVWVFYGSFFTRQGPSAPLLALLESEGIRVVMVKD